MQSIKTDRAYGVDEMWYKRLKPLMDEIGETFVTLMPSDEKLNKILNEFIASEYQLNPDLYPEVPYAKKFFTTRDELRKLRQEIQDQEKVETVRDLYVDRIDEMIANVGMILAAKDKNDTEFITANKFIYGAPNQHIFAAACMWIRQDVQNEYRHIDHDMRNEVLQLVPETKGDVSLLLPGDEVFQKVKEIHFQAGGYIDQLFGGVQIPESVIITPEIGDPIVRQVIKNIGSAFDLADSPNGLWAVLQSQQQVVRPADLALAKGPFMGIVCHEVGSHLLESTNGAAGKLKLLESGLDRYEAGNEGRAFLREQIMFDRFEDYINQPLWAPTKASWEYRVAIHVVISLATGLDGRRWTFAEIHRLLTVLFRFWTAKRGEKIDDDIIFNGAWSMAVRALKGTNGHGGAYYKDIVYLEGNLRCWEVAKTQPETVLFGDLGKFDIANNKHVRSLIELGILSA